MESATATAPQPPKSYVMPARPSPADEGPSQRTTVKKSELGKLLLTSREPILFGEYRGTKMTVKSYTSKKSGQKEEFVAVEHAIEMTDGNNQVEALVVEERQPFGLKLADIHVGLKRGQSVALRLQSLTVGDKGERRAKVEGLDGVLVVSEG